MRHYSQTREALQSATYAAGRWPQAAACGPACDNRLRRANTLAAGSQVRDYRAIDAEEIARAASGVNMADAEGVVGEVDTFPSMAISHCVLSVDGTDEGCCHTTPLINSHGVLSW
jgi:hypothetical protein